MLPATSNMLPGNVLHVACPIDTVTLTAALAVTLPTDVAPLSVDNEINSVAIANSQSDDNLQV